jgi:hypothetical protein
MVRDFRNTVGLLPFGLASCAMAAAAGAADVTPTYVGMTAQDVGVLERSRPEYDAKGIPLGGFRLFPTLDLAGAYDSNVFRREDENSDGVYTIAPTMYLKSQWGRHFLEFYAGSKSYFYSDYTDENLTDWKVGGDGRYDISRSAMLAVNAHFGEMHELWSAPNNVTGYQAKPNRYYQGHADMTAAYQPNRLGVGVGASMDRYDFTDTARIGGGVLSNDDRDQYNYQAYAKVFYDFSPGYSAFVKASYDERDFDQFYDRSDLHRSSHGFRVDGGLDLHITHLLSGEVFAGYVEQHFAQDVATPLKNVSGLDFGAKLDWYAAPLLTVHLSGKRTLDDVTITGASVADNKSVSLSADYELLRNVIVQANVSFSESAFVGTTRKYTYPGAGLAVKYLMNRYTSIDLAYSYSKRSANISGADFSDNTVSLNLKFHI